MEDSRVHLTKEKHSVSHQGRHLTEDTDTKHKNECERKREKKAARGTG